MNETFVSFQGEESILEARQWCSKLSTAVVLKLSLEAYGGFFWRLEMILTFDERLKTCRLSIVHEVKLSNGTLIVFRSFISRFFERLEWTLILMKNWNFWVKCGEESNVEIANKIK
jgi:hypothetical protein